MPADIADGIRSYGEDDLAVKVMDLRGDQLERLFELAAEHSYTGMLFAKALSLAAVEVIEGPGPAPRTTHVLLASSLTSSPC